MNIPRGFIPLLAPWLERLKFLTPLLGFEPRTERLTVACSAAELKRIVFLFGEFEVKFIVSLLHFIHGIHIFLETHVLEELICPSSSLNNLKTLTDDLSRPPNEYLLSGEFGTLIELNFVK